MATSKIISCYYSYAVGDPLQPEDINGDRMTHLIVGWSGVDRSTGRITPHTPDSKAGFIRAVALRKKFPHLKVMHICGDSYSCSIMAKNPTFRAAFIQSTLELLDDCDFDGLDLDWEFPVWRSQKCDRANFISLLRELRTAFDAHKRKLLLTIAGGAPKLIIDPAYDIPAIVPLVDFVNLMCYDFNLFTYYNTWASHNSPLFRRPDQKGVFRTLNTAWAAEYWVTKGMPREKVVVGIPTYARSWKLLFPCWHGYNAPCVSHGYAGGSMTYPQARDMLANGGTRVFDNFAMVPYAFRGRQWVSYEDEESIQLKAEWIKKNGFGGAMIFQLNADDWMGVFSPTGTCFPLVDIVSRTLNGDPR